MTRVLGKGQVLGVSHAPKGILNSQGKTDPMYKPRAGVPTPGHTSGLECSQMYFSTTFSNYMLSKTQMNRDEGEAACNMWKEADSVTLQVSLSSSRETLTGVLRDK